jgi:hypothetical protein
VGRRWASGGSAVNEHSNGGIEGVVGLLLTLLFIWLAFQFFTTPGACVPMSRPGGGDTVLVCNPAPQ